MEAAHFSKIGLIFNLRSGEHGARASSNHTNQLSYRLLSLVWDHFSNRIREKLLTTDATHSTLIRVTHPGSVFAQLCCDTRNKKFKQEQAISKRHKYLSCPVPFRMVEAICRRRTRDEKQNHTKRKRQRLTAHETTPNDALLFKEGSEGRARMMLTKRQQSAFNS